MAMTLNDGSVTVTFSPIRGYEKPDDHDRKQYKAMDGTLYIYEWSHWGKWSIPLNKIPKADYDQLLSWWQNRTQLTFTPDTDVPGTTYTVKMTNESNSLRMMFGTGWRNKHEGTLTLREVA